MKNLYYGKETVKLKTVKVKDVSKQRKNKEPYKTFGEKGQNLSFVPCTKKNVLENVGFYKTGTFLISFAINPL